MLAALYPPRPGAGVGWVGIRAGHRMWSLWSGYGSAAAG